MRVVVLVPDRDVVLTNVGRPGRRQRRRPRRPLVPGHARADRRVRGRRADDARRDRPAQPRRPSSATGCTARPRSRSARRPRASPCRRPASSSTSGRTGGVVYVVRDGVARRTEVKLGGDNGSLVEILSGIGPDDRRRSCRSGTPLEDGMRVDRRRSRWSNDAR